jgi:hypothetical protein
MMSGSNPGASGGGGGFNSNMFGSGLAGMFGGMFGNSGAPYQDAMDQYQKWANKAQGVQNPFLNAGTGAIGNYQHWLQGMQDPTKFMNNMMGQYQESPWAKFQQQQGMRAANNMGSATGMTGSTPLMQQAQQNAQNISSGDMNNWLQNVLGVNNQYGQGQQNLMGMGQNAANALTGMYGDMGRQMGEQSYNKGAASGNDFWNMLGGGIDMARSFF